MLCVNNPRCEYSSNPIGIGVKRPTISWQIKSEKRNVMQTEYQIQVAASSDFKCILWDTGAVSSDRSVHIEYEGPELLSRTRYYYRIRIRDNKGEESGWSETAFWEMGLLSKKDWQAGWITPDVPFKKSGSPCPILRRSFKAASGIKSARIYATSLGLYELYLNGKRVGDWLFTPGWTSYGKRLQYQTYDVTDQLVPGDNMIGAILGDGWYRGQLTWDMKRDNYGNELVLLLQLHITYMDGSEEVVLSDREWMCSSGAVLMSDIYDGEIYDARLEKKDWNRPVPICSCKEGTPEDESWRHAEIIEHTYDILVAQEGLPVKVMEELKPVSLFTTPRGETVIDMGQNMVGCVRFSLQGGAGSEIILQHAEVLDKEGNFYTDNLRNAKQTVHYIFKGEGIETYQPSFTFQGFRYIRVEGYTGELSLDSFRGLVIYSEMEQTGSFESSDELLNRLYQNIVWGQKGNFVDVPTDCPQRDERLGWTGDAQVFIKAASYNMNTARFFSKWLNDLKADQYDDGGIPSVIPDVMPDGRQSSSAWGDAAVICPWTLYLQYGDKRVLARQYESMKAWVEYIRSQGEDEYLWNTGFHYGDWLGLDAREGSYTGATDKDFIATAFYAWSTGIFAKAAEVLGRVDEYRKYTELAEKIRENFRREFVTSNGRLAVPTQTAHILALMFDLLEEQQVERAVATLCRYIEDNGMHIATGFVGTPYICHVLSRYGRADLAWKLVLQREYPSWLYPVTRGATTMWEHWDGIKPDGSFWSRDMNSYNHYAYGAVGDWLFGAAAGIETSAGKPGFKHMIIAPRPGGGLSYVKASYTSLYGEIKSGWSTEDGKVNAEIEIPHNTTATVILPCGIESGLTIDGIMPESIAEVSGLRYENNSTCFEIGSGKYCLKFRS